MLHQLPQLSISLSLYNLIKSLSPQNFVFYFQAAVLICMEPWQRNSGGFIPLFVFYYFFLEGGGGFCGGGGVGWGCVFVQL